MTLAERLAQGRATLTAAGIDEAEAAVDVDVYAREILGWDRARLLTEQRANVPLGLEPRFSEWVARRSRHEPTAYIVGRREFWNLSFRVTPDVLIPRPETELLVEEAIAFLRPLRAPRVADVGTGSGCLAISIAHEIQKCRMTATDVSERALAVARENAIAHRVLDQVRFVRTSYLDGVQQTYDLIVTNPPYVRQLDAGALPRATRYEPVMALFGGDDGLRDIRAIYSSSLTHLNRGGLLVTEFGYGQEADVRALSSERRGLDLIAVSKDLQGISRIAIFKRN